MSPGGQVVTIVLPGLTGALGLTLATPAADEPPSEYERPPLDVVAMPPAEHVEPENVMPALVAVHVPAAVDRKSVV